MLLPDDLSWLNEGIRRSDESGNDGSDDDGNAGDHDGDNDGDGGDNHDGGYGGDGNNDEETHSWCWWKPTR